MAMNKKEREELESLRRQRDLAVRQLEGYLDEQSKSVLYQDEFLGTHQPPKHVRRYIHGHRVAMQHAGVTVQMVARDNCVWISFSADSHPNTAMILPEGSNSITIRAMQESEAAK